MSESMRMRIAAGFLMAGLLTATALWLSGCNIVGPAAYILSGPPTAPALHQLANVPTLVFIDDRQNTISPSSLKRVIGDRVSQNLMDKKAVAVTISPQDAMSLASQVERNSKLMSVEEIGTKVGAKQVIYVQMVEFLDHTEMTPHPVITCKVRVLDLEHRQRTFPPPDSQETDHLLQVQSREADPEQYKTRAGLTQVREVMAMETGDQIAKMFYEHEPRELGGNLKPR